MDFSVVEQGELELYERKGRASYEVESTLAKLQFTGELDLLDGDFEESDRLDVIPPRHPGENRERMDDCLRSRES